MKKLCFTCDIQGYHITRSPSVFMLFGCKVKKIRFGNTTDYKAGNKMLGECAEYVEIGKIKELSVAGKMSHQGIDRCKAVLAKGKNEDHRANRASNSMRVYRMVQPKRGSAS